MKGRSVAASAVMIAFLCATALAVTPRLHELVHKVDPHHQCVVTLLASGQCEESAVAPISAVPDAPLVSGAPPGSESCLFAAPRISSILEHAPPAFA